MASGRDGWHVVADGHEIDGGLVARTVGGAAVVLFRAEDSAPVALEDRCPHRSLPLSKGTLRRDVIRCAFHGVEVDRTGVCVRVPPRRNVPPGARVRTYPVAERHGRVWIWTGDAAKADPALIPDAAATDGPG